jgi:hypothetical protein
MYKKFTVKRDIELYTDCRTKHSLKKGQEHVAYTELEYKIYQEYDVIAPAPKVEKKLSQVKENKKLNPVKEDK